MFFTILRKELALHILTLRFQIGFLVCVGLISVIAWISTVGFDKRVVEHRAIVAEAREDIAKVEVYSDLSCNHRLQAHRAPRPLAVFCQGVEGRLSDHFEIAHCLAPGQLGSMHTGDPFARMFTDYDVVTILQVILSFLALLFAYDAISGERETGTLTLVLANPGSRGQLLLGKYLGALVSLSIPLIFSFLVAIAIMQSSPYLHLSTDDWARIGLIFLLSLLYLSTFLLLGLLLSVNTQQSVTTLLWGTLCWVLLVLLYPTAVLFSVDRMKPLPAQDSTVQAVEELRQEFKREAEGFLEQRGKEKAWDGLRGSRSSSSDGVGETVRVTPQRDDHGVIDPQTEEAMRFAREFYAFQEPLRAEYADRIERLWQTYVENHLHAQAGLVWGLLRLSPSGLLAEATSMAADTDLASYQRFVGQARRFRGDLTRYLENRDAFGSRLWFTSIDDEVEISSLPHFAEVPEGFAELLGRLASRIGVLAALNGILFVATLSAFGRKQII